MKPPPGMKLQMLNDEGRPIGELHFHAKLSDADVDLVHELREGGMSLREIGDKFCVSKGCIWKILQGINRCQLATRSSLVPERAKPRQGRRPAAKKLVQPRPEQAVPRPSECSPGLALQQALSFWR